MGEQAEIYMGSRQRYIWETGRGVHLNGVDPGLDGHKGFLLGYVIHQDDAMRPSVVGLGDGLEPLLPGRVPELKGNHFVLHLENLGIEVYT